MAAPGSSDNVYLRLYLSAFRDGLVADLGPNNFMTLLAIASFMDKSGKAFPTQKQIAERLGVHENTVNRTLKNLLEYRFDGKPIITREKIPKNNGFHSSIYQIHPISQLAIFNSPIEKIQDKESQRRIFSIFERLERGSG